MRIILITFLMIAGCHFSASAQQLNERSLGIRGGLGFYGAGLELSFQNKLDGIRRLELDLGFRSNTEVTEFISTVIVQAVYQIKDGLYWYIGPAVQVVNYTKLNNSPSNFGAFGFSPKLGGQIGIEYNFDSKDIPILISLDTRPMLRLSGPKLVYIGINTAVRYTF